jgi:hypothetical protein
MISPVLVEEVKKIYPPENLKSSDARTRDLAGMGYTLGSLPYLLSSVLHYFLS